MSIISINGRLNSGKDTVGKIIQYLLIPNKGEHIDFQTFSDDALQRISGWEIKKFADKLKDIICILIGCTREQLEDQTFKATELGEEWNRTFGSYEEKYRRIAAAVTNGLNVFAVEQLIYTEAGTSEFLEEDSHLPLYLRRFNKRMTPRLLLQLVGTEGGRDLIHPNIWVNSLMSEYKFKPEFSGSAYEESGKTEIYPNWIITDMRFPNEMEAVKQKQGITIRVKRNRSDVQDENGNDLFFDENNNLIQEHPSETSLDNATFDYEIENNGTIEELIEKVKIILIQENLL